MAAQVLTIFTMLLIVQIEPVSMADPDVTLINLWRRSRFLKKTVPLHSKVTIKCIFDEPSWFKNGKPIASDNERAEFLKFDSIKKNDAGYYTCRSKFDEYLIVTLSVSSQREAGDFNSKEDLPVFVVGSRNHVATVTRKEGESYQLECEVAGESRYNITWSKDGVVMNTKTGNSSNVFIEFLTRKDTGLYVCKVCDGNNCVNSTTKIEVLMGDSEEPSIEKVKDKDEAGEVRGLQRLVHETNETTENQSTVGAAGGDLPPGKPFFTKPYQLLSLMSKPSRNMVRLKCPAAGNPIPNITWTKNGTAIQRNIDSVKYAKWSIVMEDLTVEDSGQYTCNVCNVHGCINFTTALKIKDRVNHKPIITNAFTNTTAIVGTNITIKCEVLSNFTTAIQWVKGSKLNCQNCKTIKRDANNPEVLTLYNLTHEDEGWYTCVAANKRGSSLKKTYLRVVDELPLDDIPITHPIRHHSTPINAIIMVLSGCFLVFAIIMVILCKKLKREKKKYRAMEYQWTKKVTVLKPPPIENGSHEVTGAVQMPIVRIEKQRSTLVQNENSNPALISEYEFPIDLNWEFPRNKLLLGKSLGEGAFGKVVMAEAQGLIKGQETSVVAVKMLKDGHMDADVKDLVCEMEIMKMIGKHENIINLLGCCCKDGLLFVIVEYAPHGNLKEFLRGHRYEDMISGGSFGDEEKNILIQKELISFAYQIACGMEYLASRRCIHRDLAARNVLVSDGYVMKIADFGLARDIHSQEYYRKMTPGKLPIRWMAPESLEEKFYDSQSDVWSFGVLLWEIMTLGDNPYSSIPTWDILLEHLKNGKRLKQPPLCSIDIYLFMRECWHYRPEERPIFSEIVRHLDRLVSIITIEKPFEPGVTLLQTPPSSDDDEDADGRQIERMRKYPCSRHQFSHHSTENSFYEGGI